MKSLRNLTFAMFLCSFAFVGLAAELITLAWDRSPSDNVAGYTLYYGPKPRTYTNVVHVGNALTVNVQVDSLMPRFFAVTAYDSLGVESDYSDELACSILNGRQIFWQFPSSVNFSNYRWSVEMSTNLITWQVVQPPYSLNQKAAFYRLKGV